jgi:hypothetical protein
MTTIRIAEQFSPYPAGRFFSDGPDSGQRFREQFLVPALKQEGKIIVHIDGTDGYHTSFLEEAFGGLIRFGHITANELLQRLEIVNEDSAYSIYKDLILEFIHSASLHA